MRSMLALNRPLQLLLALRALVDQRMVLSRPLLLLALRALVDLALCMQAAAAAGSSSIDVAAVREARRTPMEIHNPWNLFQQVKSTKAKVGRQK